MAYEQKRFRTTNAIEVEEYHSGRYGAPGMKREKRKKPTPQEMERINRKNREKLTRRRLRMYFDVNDYFTTLTYRKDARPPDMKTAKEHFKAFYTFVRKEYRKRGYELLWMRNIEVGTKGAWHIHVVVNRIPDTDIILAKAWNHGTVINKLCYEQGEFRDLAAYITKTPETDNRLRESHFWTSRNMPLPPAEKKTILRWETWEPDKVRIPKGFYLDPESYFEGINPVTGFPHREYTLLRIKRKEAADADRRYLHRDKHKRTKKRNRKGHVPDARKEKERKKPRNSTGGG